MRDVRDPRNPSCGSPTDIFRAAAREPELNQLRES
jgi:hypothetical protein